MSRTGQNALVESASELLEDQSTRWEPLHGGDLSDVVRMSLRSGRVVIAKSGRHPNREGRMLERLAEAGAPVPRLIARNAKVLVLEDLGAEGRPSDTAWHAVGHNLRALHATTGDRFGWGEDYAFGDVHIHNGWAETWSAFWFERRLTADFDKLPSDLVRKLRTLETRIRTLVPDDPPPALLHGDLWSGNVHFGANGVGYLIDPASYFGHAEVDLAMLTLFGAPPPSFWKGYGALDAGWERRRPAYQLWPALVHLRLFGAGYRGLVERLISSLDD